MRCRCLLKHLYLHIYISALQRQPCLLKTNSTRVLVTWLVTLLLIICPSSYKARLNNLIGTADIEPQIISPQWSNARPNFPTKNIVGGAKLGLVSRLQNDGTIDKTKVVCSICQDEFSHHRSSSSLSYHLNAKHPTESSTRLDGRQPTLHDFSRKITR